MIPPTRAATDAELVRAARKGRNEAFETLIHRHFGLVYAIALAGLGQRESAEDLTQEVFLRAYLGLERLRAPEHFAAWVGRIARNLADNWRRAGPPPGALVPLLTAAGHPLEIPDAQAVGAEEQMEVNERRQAVHDALEQLPVEQRELVLLHYMEELSQREIAWRLGMAQARVSRQIRRALAAMRAPLERLLKEETAGLRPRRQARARVLGIIAAAAALAPAAKATMAAAAVQALAASGGIPAGIGLSSWIKTVTTFYTTGGKAMIAIKSLATLLGALVVTTTISVNIHPAKAQNTSRQEAPTALELLDKYAESQKVLESCAIKLRATNRINGNAVTPQGKNFINIQNETIECEIIHNGEQFALRWWLWGKLGDNGPEYARDGARYEMRLYDGKRYCIYYVQPHAANELPRADLKIQTNTHSTVASSLSGLIYAAGDLLGYYCLIDERIDEHLRKSSKLSVRPKSETVGGFSTYVIDAVTDYGTFAIWIAPDLGYNIVQADIRRQTGDLYYKWKLSEGVVFHEQVSDIRCEQREGHWVPVSAKATFHSSDVGGDEYYDRRTVQASEFDFKPDFSARRAFELYDVREGTHVNIVGNNIGQPVIPYVWKNGKPVLKPVRE